MDMQNKWFLHDAKLSKHSPNGVRQQRIILSTKNHKDSTKLCAQNACHMILRLSVSWNRQMGKNNKSLIIIWGERHGVPSKTSHKYWIQFCIMFDSDRLSCWQYTNILKSGPHRCDRIQREICQKIEKSMVCLPSQLALVNSTFRICERQMPHTKNEVFFLRTEWRTFYGSRLLCAIYATFMTSTILCAKTK